MKKYTLVAFLILATVSSLFVSASVGNYYGTETEYYKDASFSIQVGYRGNGQCRGGWGVTSAYKMTNVCHL